MSYWLTGLPFSLVTDTWLLAVMWPFLSAWGVLFMTRSQKYGLWFMFFWDFCNMTFVNDLATGQRTERTSNFVYCVVFKIVCIFLFLLWIIVNLRINCDCTINRMPESGCRNVFVAVWEVAQNPYNACETLCWLRNANWDWRIGCLPVLLLLPASLNTFQCWRALLWKQLFVMDSATSFVSLKFSKGIELDGLWLRCWIGILRGWNSNL